MLFCVCAIFNTASLTLYFWPPLLHISETSDRLKPQNELYWMNCCTLRQSVKSLQSGLNSDPLVSFMFQCIEQRCVALFLDWLCSHLTFVSSVIALSVFLLMQQNQYWCYLYSLLGKTITGVEFLFYLADIRREELESTWIHVIVHLLWCVRWFLMGIPWYKNLHYSSYTAKANKAWISSVFVSKF